MTDATLPAAPRIGALQLSSPFTQAGLAGYSDRAMRLIARRLGASYCVTEALLDTIILQGGIGLKRSLDANAEDHPIAGQLIGAEPEPMAQAAGILADHGYDVVDLNFACPVKKIRSRARGGYLLADTACALEIVRAVSRRLAGKVPLTVKLRGGHDATERSREAALQLIESLWAEGVAGVALHPRTVEQKYTGRADWSFLAGMRQRWPEATITGSGDVFCAEDAVRMLRQTGISGVGIARGAIGNPWIFAQATALLRGDALPPPPTVHEQRDVIREHFVLARELHGEELAGRRMRKMGIYYSRLHPAAEEVRKAFIQTRSQRDWTRVLDCWYSTDAPGVSPDPKGADRVNPEES